MSYKKPQPAVLAHGLVNKAIRKGALKPGQCIVCDHPVAEAHHEDYGRPLDVIWVCRLHHRRHHDTGESYEQMRAAAWHVPTERLAPIPSGYGIRALRQQRGLDLDEVARRAEMSVHALINLERYWDGAESVPVLPPSLAEKPRLCIQEGLSRLRARMQYVAHVNAERVLEAIRGQA